MTQGACHCGEIQFKCEPIEGSERRCNCSFCSMRGALPISAPSSSFELIAGEPRVYQFGSKSAAHYFCGTCGIYTHHVRRSNPENFGVNVACIGRTPYPPTVMVSNGLKHVSDGHEQTYAGYLVFEPTL